MTTPSLRSLCECALELYGSWKKYPIFLADYPHVNELIDMCPQIAKRALVQERQLQVAKSALNYYELEFNGARNLSKNEDSYAFQALSEIDAMEPKNG